MICDRGPHDALIVYTVTHDDGPDEEVCATCLTDDEYDELVHPRDRDLESRLARDKEREA